MIYIIFYLNCGNNIKIMAVTRLERKGRKNVSKAKRAKQVIKSLNAKPDIRNVDIEEIKKGFVKSSKKSPKK